MSNIAMREKFNYTQRPANERKFIASEMAKALEITLPSFYELMRKLDLDREIVISDRGRKVLVFSHEALACCREELERRKKNDGQEAAQVIPEAAKDEHPLVIDERFLKLSYFPDVVPACFAEVDE